MNQIFKTALSGELNRTMRGIGTIYKTALSQGPHKEFQLTGGNN